MIFLYASLKLLRFFKSLAAGVNVQIDKIPKYMFIIDLAQLPRQAEVKFHQLSLYKHESRFRREKNR